MHERGLLTLANDPMYDWLVALLESVRRHEPQLPITVIPYDSRTARIAKLQSIYDFELLPERELAEIDELSGSLWPGGKPLLRKIAAFDGPYDNFLFLDADIVVLEPLGRFFDVHADGHVHYFVENRHEVYDPGPFRARMVADHASRGINTGQWGGKRGVLSLDAFRSAAAQTAEVRQDSFWIAGEQTFLNYTFDISPVRLVAYADVVPGLGDSWAGTRYARTDAGLVEQLTATQQATGTAPMLHWAGYSLGPTMPFYREWKENRLRSATRMDAARYLGWTWTRHVVGHARRLRKRLGAKRS